MEQTFSIIKFQQQNESYFTVNWYPENKQRRQLYFSVLRALMNSSNFSWMCRTRTAGEKYEMTIKKVNKFQV